MALSTYDFIAGDTGSILRVSILNKQTKTLLALDGTHTAQIVWSIDEAASVSRVMTVLPSPNDGKVEYQFLVGELTPGTMIAQVKITEISSGDVVTTINDIKKQIGPSL